MEHSSFTPLVFSASGGMGHEASVFYKQLASLLSDKWNDSYATVLDVDCYFVCYVQQSSALEERDLHKVITSKVLLWPWCNQRLSF